MASIQRDFALPRPSATDGRESSPKVGSGNRTTARGRTVRLRRLGSDFDRGYRHSGQSTYCVRNADMWSSAVGVLLPSDSPVCNDNLYS